MIFIGFGFLMTFLKKYGFSSVGLNFVLSALTIQVSMLVNAFFEMAFHEGGAAFHEIKLDIIHLIKGDFAAGCAMVSFGAMLGKTSPLEMVFIVTLEMIFYALNENIGVNKLKVVDMGGSIFVHTFGAYFGLACSWMLTPKSKFTEKNEGSTYTSDTFAMIGTIFLWMFWPSFNGALATGTQQHRVILNTVMALTASCLTTFAMSALMRHENKFDMVDIQNATLAGGVAVGSASDLVIGPWGAILLGVVAGVISVLGYTVIQPWLQRNHIVHDTCGVHNLHGMPGILGGIGGACSAAVTGDTTYGEGIATIYSARDPAGDNRSAVEQGGYQVAALVTTLAISIVGGILVGAFVKYFLRRCVDEGPKQYFHDGDYWEGVCELESCNASMELEKNAV